MQPRAKVIKSISPLCLSLTNVNIQEIGEKALLMAMENYASKMAAHSRACLSKDCEKAEAEFLRRMETN